MKHNSLQNLQIEVALLIIIENQKLSKTLNLELANSANYTIFDHYNLVEHSEFQ